MLNGALLALEEVNADPASGILLQPQIADPSGKLAQYSLFCNELIQSGARHIVGCYTSSSRKELIPIVEKRDALLWYPSHYEGFESSSNVIYTGAVPNQHIVPLIDYVLLKRNRRVFCVGSNYIWAWENNRVLREVLLPHGGSILAERYFPVGEHDFSQVIEVILAARPNFIFNTLIGSSAYQFFSQFRSACQSRGIDQAQVMPLLSCSLSEPELVEIASEARDGHISSSVYFSSIESAENRCFTEAYCRRFPNGPAVSADAEASYIAVHLLALALAAAGTDDINAVAEAASRQVLRAPQGEVRIDGRTMHAYLTPRLGRSRADGSFDILREAAAPVQPDPYLIRHTASLEAVSPARLRIVS